MEIVDIFAPHLYVFHYQENNENEYFRLMEMWTDVSYLNNFAKINNVKDVHEFIQRITDEADDIDDFIHTGENNGELLEEYFQPLHNAESGAKVLSPQKGKLNNYQLRLYALKIESNSFVITGGAIKMTQTMQAHPDTAQELIKIKQARGFLQANGVFDKDSFDDFKEEMI
jgi:hypothetical protein